MLKGPRPTSRRWLHLLPLVSVLLGACGDDAKSEDGPGSPQSPPAVSNPMPEEAQRFVDQGNTAQREGRYNEALVFYQDAMALAPDHPVPQFGGLMVALAVGDATLAESLRKRLEVTGHDLLAMLGTEGTMGEGPADLSGDPHSGGGDPPIWSPDDHPHPSGQHGTRFRPRPLEAGQVNPERSYRPLTHRGPETH